MSYDRDDDRQGDEHLEPGDVDPDKLGDTPDLDLVYQRETYENPDPVEVCIKHPLFVDPLPRRLGVGRTIVLPTAAEARRIVGDDPRRARFQFLVYPPAAGAEGILIAGTQAECELFKGAFYAAISTAQVRFELEVCSELWVKPVDLSATGVLSVSTGPILLSYLTELWSR